MQEFEDRVIIITGAAQGLGRAYAKRFAEYGAYVVVADNNAQGVRRVAGEIEAEGGKAVPAIVDVSDPDGVDAMVAAAAEPTGRIDVLVNNAALATALGRRPFTEIPLEEFRRVLDVNITGSFLCARAVVPYMRKAKWGRIINVSSTTIAMGRVNMLHYVASKAAVVGMSRSMARELGSFGVTVNTLLPGLTPHEVSNDSHRPGYVEAITAIQCIPRLETPEDLVGAVVFLASEASGFITGQALAVDGGGVHLG